NGGTLDMTNNPQTVGGLSSTDGKGSKVLLGNATLTVAQNINTTFDGSISGVGGSLDKEGTGILVLSGDNTYTGSTMVGGGSLVAVASTALPGGTNLTIGPGGTFIFDPAYSGGVAVSSGAASAVPEPGTFALLVAGAIVAFAAWRRKRS